MLIVLNFKMIGYAEYAILPMKLTIVFRSPAFWSVRRSGYGFPVIIFLAFAVQLNRIRSNDPPGIRHREFGIDNSC
jgi:hypothetical protein